MAYGVAVVLLIGLPSVNALRVLRQTSGEVAGGLSQENLTSGNRFGFTDGDVPRDTRLWDGLGARDGDQYLESIVDYMGNDITYTSEVGPQIQGFTQDMLIGLYGDTAGALLGIVNPMLALAVSIIRAFFSPADQYRQLVKSILEHVDKMIEAAIDAQVVETIRQEIATVSGNMEWATDRSSWAGIINDQEGTAKIFSNACSSNAGSSTCRDYQMRNGGEKFLLEMFWVDLLAGTWLEARRSGWSNEAGRTSVRFSSTLAILKTHWSRYSPWRTDGSRFSNGVDPWYEEGETCYTPGRDEVTNNLLISANCPGTYNGLRPSDYLDYKDARSIVFCQDGNHVSAWYNAVESCRWDYKDSLSGDMNRLNRHLNKLTQLNATMQQAQR